MLNTINKIKTHQVEVAVTGPFLNHFILNLYRQHIAISNLKYQNAETITFTTDYENVLIIQDTFTDYQIKIINNKGIYRFIPWLKHNKIFLICLLLGIIIFSFCQNIIVRVDVIHSDKKIRELVTEELEENNIKRLTFKKSYQELQKIKNKILAKYPDKLEWIEIENVGMTYKVRIEERIITKFSEDNNFCHIIALKDGIITKIISEKGEKLKDKGDYVSKGDIIISGDIKANEEVKNSLCAKGEVYGEVWYTVNVSIPLNYEKKLQTGRKRWNLMYDNGKEKQTIFKSRFKNYEVKNTKLFSILGYSFYKQTELELKVTKEKYTLNEALEEALKQAKSKVKLKLHDKERIITQKVLNKSVKNSKMKVEIFVSVEESIGKQVEYKV